MTKEFVVSVVSLFAWRESALLAPGSRPAMIGIVHCLANRVLAGMWGSDWLLILRHSREVSSHDLEPGNDYPDLWNPDWRWLTEQVGKIYDNRRPDDVTCSADMMQAGFPGGNRPGLFYANLQLPLRAWFQEKIVSDPENHPRTAECQPLVFFG